MGHVVRTDDDAELAVWSFGPEDGQAVVLVHGYSLDHTTWEPVANRLAGKGYRAIAPDLRGHGRSTLGTAAPTPDRLVADIDAVASELGLAALHLVGHSLGAVVALAARADTTMSVSILSVTSIAGTEQSIQNPVMRVGAYLFSSRLGVWALRRKWLGRLIISTWFGKKPTTQQLDSIRSLSASCRSTTRIAIGKATAHLDLRPSFKQSGPPTLVMCGRNDKATPFKVSQRIADAIDAATLVPIDTAGHMLIIERPDIVADELDAWLTTLQ